MTSMMISGITWRDKKKWAQSWLYLNKLIDSSISSRYQEHADPQMILIRKTFHREHVFEF